MSLTLVIAPGPRSRSGHRRQDGGAHGRYPVAGRGRDGVRAEPRARLGPHPRGNLFLGLVIFLTTVLPPLLAQTHLGTGSRIAFEILRWPTLALLMAIGIGLLYPVLGTRAHRRRFRFHHPGHTMGTVVGWLIVSVLFGAYTTNFTTLQQDVRSARVDRGRPPLALAQLAAHPVRSRGRPERITGGPTHETKPEHGPRRSATRGRRWRHFREPPQRFVGAGELNGEAAATKTHRRIRLRDVELAGRACLGHVSGGGRRGAGNCPANRGDRVEGGDERITPPAANHRRNETTAAWLPNDFVHPERLKMPTGHHLRPIRESDVGIDYPAVMGSHERLWAIFGRAWGWPPATMTHAQDQEDLARHRARSTSTARSTTRCSTRASRHFSVACTSIRPRKRAPTPTSAGG